MDMDDVFYKVYDETYGTSYSAPEAPSAAVNVPKEAAQMAQQMEILLNDVDYGRPWTVQPQKVMTDRSGKEICVCALTNTQSGSKYKIHLPMEQPVQGLYDWIESQYGHLRRLFRGLQDWEKEQAQKKVQEFDQLPENVKRMIVKKFSEK